MLTIHVLGKKTLTFVVCALAPNTIQIYILIMELQYSLIVYCHHVSGSWIMEKKTKSANYQLAFVANTQLGL